MGKTADWALCAAASREWVRPPLGSTGGFPCVPEGVGGHDLAQTEPHKNQITIRQEEGTQSGLMSVLDNVMYDSGATCCTRC